MYDLILAVLFFMVVFSPLAIIASLNWADTIAAGHEAVDAIHGPAYRFSRKGGESPEQAQSTGAMGGPPQHC